MGVFILFILEVVWDVMKFFGYAVLTVFKVITHYLLLVLKPVYKFMYKALPITTVLVSCSVLFMIFGLIWYSVTNNIENTQSNNEYIEVGTSGAEKDGIFDAFLDRATIRVDKVGNKILSSMEKLEQYEYTGEFSIWVLVFSIVAFALIPILAFVFLVILIVAAFCEILILGLLLDVLRHIYICVRYRPNIKDTLVKWLNYALSDYICMENSEDTYSIEDN